MLKEIREDLNKLFIGREAEIDSLILAWLTNQNVLLLGKPGTGKSLLAKMFSTMVGCKHYTHQMNKETSVSEIFGPYSIKSYKEHDRYIRIRKGTLLEAETADLDEIFKCNSATLNALLNALNERVYKEEGVDHPIPLRMVIGASNELPEGPELNALYDRFLFRHDVRSLDFEERELLACRASSDTMDLHVMDEEKSKVILGTAQMIISQTPLSTDIRKKYWEISEKLKFTHGITVSERRDRQIFQAMKANAYLNDRCGVTADDFSILEHVMWTKPDQRSKIADVVIAVASPGIVEIRKLQDAMIELRNRVDVAKGTYGVRDDILMAINKDKNDILKRCEDIVKENPVQRVKAIYEDIIVVAGKIRAKVAAEMNL